MPTACMNKTLLILAGMMAAILLTSAIAPYSAFAEKNDDKKNKHEEIKKRIEEIKQRIIAKHENSNGTFTATQFAIDAEGLAVTRSNSGLQADEATLDLTGKTYKQEGSHTLATFNGTLDIDDEQYKINAEGKIKLESGIGVLQIKGKATKGNDEQKFQLRAMLVKAGDGKWKMVVHPAAQLGSHVRIYTLMGELKTTGGSLSPPPIISPALDHFKISTIGNQTAGAQFTFTVRAIDTNGDIKEDYNGTITITTNAGSSPAGNASVIVPNPYTFTAADDGKHTFTAKIYNAKSNVTITVSGSGKTATSNKFNVVPAAIANVTITPASATIASNGTATFSSEAFDAYGNKVSTSFIWAASPSIGALTISANTVTATLKAPIVNATSTGILSSTASGTSVTDTTQVTVNPP